LIALIGFAVLCLLGPAEIETGPVDLSLQTLFIMLLALLYRPAVVFILLVLYLIVGGLGFPVFAGYSGGFEHIKGPTMGFLLWFPFFGALFSISVKYLHSKPFLIGIAALISQFLLLLVGFSYLWFRDYSSISHIGNNMIGLLPGLFIKSVLIIFLHYLILRLFGSAKLSK
jgi:biotin transporter BioY